VTTPARPIPALPAPSSTTAVITRILTVAASQIGYREGRDANGNWNNDNVYGVWYPMNWNAWCAMFVSWSAFNASVPETVIPKHAYTPSGWNWFKAQKRTVSTPQRGDIMYVYSSSIGLVHHVGLVEKVLSGGRIQTIEGNTNTSGSAQGDGVYRLTRTVSSKLLFARPDYAACVTNKPAPGVTPTLPPVARDVTITAACIKRLATDHLGVSDACLVDNQQVMNIAAYFNPAMAETTRPYFWKMCAEGNWAEAGKMMAYAVRIIQAKAGLPQDGVFGPKTAAFLAARGYTIK
jgi:hypothetical protein